MKKLILLLLFCAGCALYGFSHSHDCTCRDTLLMDESVAYPHASILENNEAYKKGIVQFGPELRRLSELQYTSMFYRTQGVAQAYLVHNKTINKIMYVEVRRSNESGIAWELIFTFLLCTLCAATVEFDKVIPTILIALFLIIYACMAIFPGIILLVNHNIILVLLFIGTLWMCITKKRTGMVCAIASLIAAIIASIVLSNFGFLLMCFLGLGIGFAIAHQETVSDFILYVIPEYYTETVSKLRTKWKKITG